LKSNGKSGLGEARPMGTALIVEDHPDQAQMVAGLLRFRNFEPIVAGTGEAGLKLAREHRPDVVILDLMLPDISGFDVCRQLRSDRATMLTPVVMLTALGDATNRVQGFRVGANAYVTKPYGMQELIDAINAARAWRSQIEATRLHGEIHVELNSEVTLLQDLNDFLLSLCQSTPLTNEQVMHLRQAVMEMGQNAIEWGNKHQSDRLVNITYRVYDDHVEIIIRDQGSGFDRANIPHAAAADDPFSHLDVRDKLGLRSGGFGLLICEGMVDELRYNDVGNEVTLIKRFQPDGRTDRSG
jgi:DNA-binding response OmpR family regulator